MVSALGFWVVWRWFVEDTGAPQRTASPERCDKFESDVSVGLVDSNLRRNVSVFFVGCVRWNAEMAINNIRGQIDKSLMGFFKLN